MADSDVTSKKSRTAEVVSALGLEADTVASSVVVRLKAGV